LSEAEEPDQPALDEHVKWADVLVGEVTRWPWEKPHERKQVNFPEIRGGRSSRYVPEIRTVQIAWSEVHT
jgi:hypothetical protein